MEGFKSSAHFDKEHADERLLTDQIKAHMTIIKHTPLIGQDMMGVIEDKPISLGFKLSPELIEKLGKFKQIYDACVSAQKRFNLACTKYHNTEREYGNMKEVQTKLAKVQNNIDMCSDIIKQIKAVFQ